MWIMFGSEIYRPGMMRKGVDITLNPVPQEEEASDKSRNYRQPPRSPGRDRYEYRTYENSNRRRQREDARNGDSGSTTPESYHQEDYRRIRGSGMDRRGGRRGPPSEYSHNGSRDDLASESSYVTRASGYNSTQSLLDSRPRPGGYLDQRTGQKPNDRPRNDRGPESSRQLNRMNRPQFERNTDRASMRAETMQRRRGGGGAKGSRNRNDSLNSTQSERPASLYVDTSDRYDETRSVGGAPSEAPSSQGLSFAELCASFDSMGSMNWSEIVQEDFAAENEPAQSNDALELKARLQASQEGETGERRREKAPRGIITRGGYAQRMRRDSDRSSSVADSIVEERSDSESRDETFGEESERDGESTPTRLGSPEPSESPDFEEEVKNLPNLRPQAKGRWKGRITYENEEEKLNEPTKEDKKLESMENIKKKERKPVEEPAAKTRDPMQRLNRLKGRVSLQAEPYQPPAMRIKERSTTASTDSTPRASIDENRERLQEMVISTSKERTSTSKEDQQQPSVKILQRKEKESTETSSSYQKIKEQFGEKITAINDQMDLLIPDIAARNIESAKKAAELSAMLSEIYLDFLTKDIVFTFTMNLETHLWKQAYYKIIESLRSGSNSVRDAAEKLRNMLRSVIINGISYYKRLFALYESQFAFKVSAALFWPKGFSTDDLRTAQDGLPPLMKFDGAIEKVALKSLSRHHVSLGNLYRYLAIVEASEDFGRSQCSYLFATQLWPENGLAYNQLAILAYNMMLYRSRVRTRLTPVDCLSDQRQGRVIDETYYLARAIAAPFVFETAKDRMTQRLSAMIRKIEKYEPVLDKEFGKNKDEAEIALQKDRPSEIWVRKDGQMMKKEEEDFVEDEIIGQICQQSASTVHRRCVSYLVGVAAMLYTKINLNQFTSVSSRALALLAANLELEDSRLSALQLSQLSAVFIFLVHNAQTKNEENTLTYQQQLSFSFLISYFGVLLRPVAAGASSISSWLEDENLAPQKVIRVLPSLSIISYWMSSPNAKKDFESMTTLEPLISPFFQVDTWGSLAQIANALTVEDGLGRLLKNSNDVSGPILVVLPELNLLSSFCNVFPSPPPINTFASTHNTELSTLCLSLHVRLRVLFSYAKFLDAMDTSCFGYDAESKRFIYRGLEESAETKTKNLEPGHEIALAKEKSLETTRENLTDNENKRRNRVLLVKPLQLVPDTNGFVDHLELIKKIVASDHYTLLVPTIVITELTGLALAPRPSENEEHALFVHAQAKVATQWFKEQCKLKPKNIGTLTSRGQKMRISMLEEETKQDGLRQINDDRIVSSCSSFAESCVLPPISNDQVPDLPNDSDVILRGVVLLTEDRGVQIKASASNIPTRTLASFVKWAGL